MKESGDFHDTNKMRIPSKKLTISAQKSLTNRKSSLSFKNVDGARSASKQAAKYTDHWH